MKKINVFASLVLIGLLFSSCEEPELNPDSEDEAEFAIKEVAGDISCVIESYTFTNGFPNPSYTVEKNENNLITKIVNESGNAVSFGYDENYQLNELTEIESNGEIAYVLEADYNGDSLIDLRYRNDSEEFTEVEADYDELNSDNASFNLLGYDYIKEGGSISSFANGAWEYSSDRFNNRNTKLVFYYQYFNNFVFNAFVYTVLGSDFIMSDVEVAGEGFYTERQFDEGGYLTKFTQGFEGQDQQFIMEFDYTCE